MHFKQKFAIFFGAALLSMTTTGCAHFPSFLPGELEDLEIEATPYKTFVQGDNLVDSMGVTIKGIYSNKKTKVIPTSDVELIYINDETDTGYDYSRSIPAAGEYTLRARYQGITSTECYHFSAVAERVYATSIEPLIPLEDNEIKIAPGHKETISFAVAPFDYTEEINLQLEDPSIATITKVGRATFVIEGKKEGETNAGSFVYTGPKLTPLPWPFKLIVDPVYFKIGDTIHSGLKDPNTQYNLFFDYTSKIEIELFFSDQVLYNLCQYGDKKAKEGENANFNKNEMYHPCVARITINGMQAQYWEVGARMRGNTSRDVNYFDANGNFHEDHLIHFKLNFRQTWESSEDNDYFTKVWDKTSDKKARKNRRFGGMRKFDLKWNKNYDKTFTKEAYALNAFRSEGIIAQHSNLVQLTVHSSTGMITHIYQAYECIDQEMINRNPVTKASTEGDLYKCAHHDRGRADLMDYDNDKIGMEKQGYRPVYDKKIDDHSTDYSRMKTLIDKIQSTRYKSGDEFINIMSPYLDIDYFIKYSAMSWAMGLPDDFRNNFNNYYVFFYNNKKAMIAVYDNDRCLGIMQDWAIHVEDQTRDDKHALGTIDQTEAQSALIFRMVTGGSNNSWPVHEQSKRAYMGMCVTYYQKYLQHKELFDEFTAQFYYSKDAAREVEASGKGKENLTFSDYVDHKYKAMMASE